MSTETIEVSTPRGTMPVHVHRPGGEGSRPVVVLYMDAPGIRPALHEHAEHGYTMPDRPAYNRDAAERAWSETLELLRRRL